MWVEQVRALGDFPDAVPNWLDEPPRPGFASVLCHSHDARLWQLRSFLIKGRLDGVDG